MAGRITSTKNSFDLPACSAVLPPIAQSRAAY